LDREKELRRAGWRLMGSAVRPQLGWVITGVVAGAVWTGAKIAVPFFAAQAIDKGILPGDGGTIAAYAGAILLVGLVQATGTGLRRYSAFRISYRAETDLRQRLFAHLQRLHFAFHDQAQTGQLMARANSDIQQVNQVVILLPLTISNVLILFGTVAVMFLISETLALFALAALPVLALAATRFSHRIAPVSLELQQELGDLSGVVEESVAGVRVVKGFGSERRQVERLDVEADSVLDRALTAARLRSGFLPLVDFLPALALVAILWYGGHQVLDGDLKVGNLVQFNSYILMLIWPLRLGGMLVAQAARSTAAAGRIYEVLATDTAVTDPPHPHPLPPYGRGELRFEGVRFAYGDGPPVLDDFDLEVRGGEAVAVVGPTGSGKTTIARLLPRFYDVDGGRVLLDGVDVRDVRLRELRRSIGIVFEDTFLFSESVFENIAFADPEAPMDAVRRAAELAGAAEFVDELPEGYDTVIGEHGYSLSGGQRQRVAIARAVLADPRVLILDDATSSVYPTKEHEIRAALQQVMRDRTTLIIAHRAATIALADRVVLLDGGRIVAEGTHQELLASSLRYREVLAQSEARHTVVVPAPGRRMRGGGGRGAWGSIVVEETLSRDQSKRVLRRLWRMLRPWRGRIFLATLLIVGQTACLLAGPALVQHGIDDGLLPHNASALNLCAALYLAVALFALVMGRLSIRAVARIGETFLRRLRVRVFQHLLSLGLDFFEREKTGRLVARLTSDVDAMQELVQTGLTMLVQNILIFIGAFIAIFVTSWQLALCTLVVVPPVYLSSRWFRRASNRAYLEVRERIGTNLATLQEGLAGVRVVQAFGRERAFTRRFYETNESLYDANLETARIATRYFPVVEYAGVTGIAIIVGVGGFFVDQKIVALGAVAAFVLYLNSLFEPIQQLSQLYNVIQSAGAALFKLFELLDTRASITERPGAVDLPVQGELVVDDVSFAYGNGPTVLHNVSLTVAPAERLALVGPTGAGKSTLAKLIARFYDPREGVVRYGNTDLRDGTIRSLRERIVVVPQEGFLFAGSIRENVRVGRPEATDADVDAALDALGVRDRFLLLPDGLDTEVRERGSRLSAGERQLVSLARAALADPAVLVLDEATSNLDPGTERAVERALEALTSNRTVVVIAHRLSTAARADRVAVIDHGRLQEIGTHDELLHVEGRYASLWASWTAAQSARAS
jgi:ATP-binding cassette subfamily B protein